MPAAAHTKLAAAGSLSRVLARLRSNRPFRISNGRAYGPGVIDNKGGVVLGIYAMKVLKSIDFKQYGQII